MFVEIRRYEILPGKRDEFVAFFDEEVVPEMEAVGMRIVGTFVSTEDENAFFYLRAFDDEQQREQQYQAFYEGEAWLTDLKQRALPLETGYHVEVVEPTAGSRLR